MTPILGALVLQAMYGAVDLLVVGRFGSTAGLSAPVATCFGIILNIFFFIYIEKKGGVNCEYANSELC